MTPHLALDAPRRAPALIHPQGPVKISPDAHPMLHRLWQEMRAQQIGVVALAERHGLIRSHLIHQWFNEGVSPKIANLDDCFNLLGLRLDFRVVKKRHPRKPPRWTPIPIANVHPLVRRTFERANRHRWQMVRLSEASGIACSVLYRWADAHACPLLPTMDRLVTTLGCELVVREMKEADDGR